jgi:glyoxylase-like metal-dependent hydrolase (beta-lactamase superfamily II)
VNDIEIRFLNGGHCKQLQALVDRRTWRIVRFHAVFLAVRHPSRGWILVDCGYSTHFHAATRAWPYRLYSCVTPVASSHSTAEILRDAGIDPESIADIVLTHFHADHIGGVRDFPRAQFHFAASALAPLRGMAPLRQTINAFLPALLPADFDARSAAVPKAAFVVDDALDLPAHDVFGDGSLSLVSLPGHAPGHCGVFFPGARGGPFLWAADGFWHRREIDEATRPLPPARMLLHDSAAYETTKSRLREIRSRGIKIAACHCPFTQQWQGGRGW